MRAFCGAAEGGARARDREEAAGGGVLQEGLRHLIAGPTQDLIEAERDFLSRALRLLEASALSPGLLAWVHDSRARRRWFLPAPPPAAAAQQPPSLQVAGCAPRRRWCRAWRRRACCATRWRSWTSPS